LQDHGATMKRNVKVINLDPAAEKFNYNVDIDVKSLITVSDVMEKMKFGPNGALIYCMEYLIKHISWLEDQILEMGENVYFLIDCPGQLELYSHYNVIKTLTKSLRKMGVNVCSVFCLDSTFLQEQSKFISGCTLSLASMVQLELPHLTVVTKCDLIEDKTMLANLNELDAKSIASDLNPMMGRNMEKLNEALTELIDSFSLVDLYPLDASDEDSINAVLYHADTILQYYDNQEPRDEYYNNIEGSHMDQDQEQNDDFI
jgi:hypothetical protein